VGPKPRFSRVSLEAHTKQSWQPTRALGLVSRNEIHCRVVMYGEIEGYYYLIRSIKLHYSATSANVALRTMEKSKIRVIYEYEFRRGTTVSETARNINAVFGEGSTTKATVGNWSKNFRDGDFSLANEPRERPKTKVDNDHLRAVVESDPSQSTRELASIFNVSIPTILFI
ncbi:hypothetical protein DMN91_012281, partial [Ooceraea biroi]